MKQEEIVKLAQKHSTPFYLYNLSLLNKTVQQCKSASGQYGYKVHYALKANANSPILEIMKANGFGADCVSGNEVKCAINNGFNPKEIVFAGVGKSDEEIRYALETEIFSFNCESAMELEVINELAGKNGKTASVALRINPNVDAYTHKYITTGLEENKFGINAHEFEAIAEKLKGLNNLRLTGLHFHIGSQITDLTPFRNLCLRVNEIQSWFVQKGFSLPHLNLGGGLGINYQQPDSEAIPDFEKYFGVFKEHLQPLRGQEVHFELGRSLVAQCGSLISRVLYIKNGINTNFAILDAGMTELIRPALYQAFHKIENLSGKIENRPFPVRYDVVGPICESSDCFGKAVDLTETRREDIIAIRSTGAYGEVMSSGYNLRDRVAAVYL